jgi:hypothetical protein
MRGAVVSLLLMGLLSCRQTTAFISADDVTGLPKGAAAAPPCNEVAQHGQPIFLTGSRDVAPSPTGGTIEDGTYVLTSSILYTKARPHGARLVEMGRMTMMVKGGTSQLVRTDADEHERRTTVNRASAGTVATLETVCASPNPNKAEATVSTSYTATPTSVQFITPSPAGTMVATYTRL